MGQRFAPLFLLTIQTPAGTTCRRFVFAEIRFIFSDNYPLFWIVSHLFIG